MLKYSIVDIIVHIYHSVFKNVFLKDFNSFYYLSPAGDYNLHHVCVYVGARVCHAVFSETTTVTHFW